MIDLFPSGRSVVEFPAVRRLTVMLAATVMLSSCGGNATFPAPSIATALTPTQSENADPEKASEQQTSDATAADATDGPDERLALAPAQPVTNSRAVAAAERAASAGNAGDSDAQETSSAKPETQQAGAPKKDGSLFGGFFQSNTSGAASTRERGGTSTSLYAKRTTTTTTSRTTRTSVGSSSADRPRGRTSGLPGVDLKRAFGVDDEIEREEFDEEPMRVASVTNLARRGTHGLILQRPNVKVGCFPRELLSILKQVERRYRRVPIVTSGFRDPRHNARVRGARNSTHTRCLAADIQVKGVSKWKLAKFLRSLPGRGGVGTYCHTKSVHIDIGSKRAWHHCRRSRKGRRRKS